MPDMALRVAERLTGLKWMLSTAESCTGGMIAAHCTDLAGSSAWFDRGFITYSNEAKAQMLGVPNELIAIHGAVSEPVALAMALGAVYWSGAQASIAVTGVAGPSGGGLKNQSAQSGWHGASTVLFQLKSSTLTATAIRSGKPR